MGGVGLGCRGCDGVRCRAGAAVDEGGHREGGEERGGGEGADVQVGKPCSAGEDKRGGEGVCVCVVGGGGGEGEGEAGGVQGLFFKPALPAQLVGDSEACKVCLWS